MSSGCLAWIAELNRTRSGSVGACGCGGIGSGPGYPGGFGPGRLSEEMWEGLGAGDLLALVLASVRHRVSFLARNVLLTAKEPKLPSGGSVRETPPEGAYKMGVGVRAFLGPHPLRVPSFEEK